MVEAAGHDEENLVGNVMKVSAKGNVRAYIKHALEQFEKNDSVETSAAGKAIAKNLVFVELLKREANFEIHQTTSIESTQMEDARKDESKVKIKGIDEADQKVLRTVTIMKIKLSKNAPEQQELGYQAPVTAEEREEHKKSREEQDKLRKQKKPAQKPKAEPAANKPQKRDNHGGRGNRQRLPRTYNDDIEIEGPVPARGPPRGAPRGNPRGRGARGRNAVVQHEHALE